MSIYQGTGLAEGASVTRPPLFDGTNYSYWKNRMCTYLKSMDFEQWKVTTLGDYEITKINENGVKIPKDISEYDNTDMRRSQMNARALTSFHCALTMDEYNKISSCQSSKEIWDKLEVAHEGTSQVKDDNINMLVHDYELFKMEQNESLNSMYSRLSIITNALDLLGKVYSNEDKIRKILRILPKKWRPKVTAIQEAKDLKILSMDELLGSLKTHERELEREDQEQAKPKKNLALKAIQNEVNHENGSKGGDEDIALLSRKFIKFLAKKKHSQGKLNNNSSSSTNFNDRSIQTKVNHEERKCFHCHKPGHYESNCPVKRKEKEKKENFYKKLKHALKGRLSESEEDESDTDSSDEETADLCLMAKDEEAYQS